MPRGAIKGERRGGRPKGVKNKRTQLVINQLNDLECDPIKGLATIAKESMERQDYTLAAHIYKELAQYMYPKRRAIEVSTEVSSNLEIEDLTDQQRMNLKKLL